MANDLILGLDVGTSSVKALFVDVTGAILKRVEVEGDITYSCEPKVDGVAVSLLSGGEGLDRVDTRVDGEVDGDRFQGISEGTDGVLIDGLDVVSSVNNSEGGGDFRDVGEAQDVQ